MGTVRMLRPQHEASGWAPASAPPPMHPELLMPSSSWHVMDCSWPGPSHGGVVMELEAMLHQVVPFESLAVLALPSPLPVVATWLVSRRSCW